MLQQINNSFENAFGKETKEDHWEKAFQEKQERLRKSEGMKSTRRQKLKIIKQRKTKTKKKSEKERLKLQE